MESFRTWDWLTIAACGCCRSYSSFPGESLKTTKYSNHYSQIIGEDLEETRLLPRNKTRLKYYQECAVCTNCHSIDRNSCQNNFLAMIWTECFTPSYLWYNVRLPSFKLKTWTYDTHVNLYHCQHDLLTTVTPERRKVCWTPRNSESQEPSFSLDPFCRSFRFLRILCPNLLN
jgi:hypothetical protein